MEPGSQLAALAMLLPPLPHRLLVGVSGGADSVALLRLALLKGCEVQAVHVNHGLRGRASDEDEVFVRRLCAALQTPLLVYRAHPPERAGEAWARQARYAFFHEAMAQTGCEALALAHHRDDQAETLLEHLLRGAGLTGLSGMAAVSEHEGMRLVRPLLTFSRRQLQDALRDAGQTWQEDASNADVRYLRNAVRWELLPLMERLAPGAGERLAATAALLRQEEDGLAVQAEAFLQAHGGSTWVCLRPLLGENRAMQARIIRLLWQRAAGHCQAERSLSRQQTEALLALLPQGAGSRCNLPEGWHGVRGWHCLHVCPPEDAPSAVDECPVTAQGAALHGVWLCVMAARETPGDGRLVQVLPRALLEGSVVRYRRPGDWLAPYGGTGRQSLQDYLVNRRVDAPFRGQVPLLCRGSEVLLVCGVGAGRVPLWHGQEEYVSVQWMGAMPWIRDE